MELNAENLSNKSHSELVNIILVQQTENNELKSKLNSLINDVEILKGELVKNSSEEKFEIGNINERIARMEMNMEKRMAHLEQYGRRDCVEFVVLPTNIEQSKLKETVIKVFNTTGTQLTKRDFHGVHYLHDYKTIIAKLVCRDDAENILRSKKLLRELPPDEKVKLGVAGTLYVNDSLCPSYRRLMGKCSALYKDNHLDVFFSIYGKIVIKYGGKKLKDRYSGGFSKRIEHVSDLVECFGEAVMAKYQKLVDHDKGISHLTSERQWFDWKQRMKKMVAHDNYELAMFLYCSLKE